MIPYAEPGLLSEASLTSSSLCPEVAEPAEAKIDSCRPWGQPAREVHYGKLKLVCWKENGKLMCCPLSDLIWGVIVHTGTQWVSAGKKDPQPQHTPEDLFTLVIKGQKLTLANQSFYVQLYCMKNIIFHRTFPEHKSLKGNLFPFFSSTKIKSH